MKFFLLYIISFALPIYPIAAINDHPEINIPKVKDRVTSTKLRTSILEIAEASLNRPDETFISTIEEVENPYLTNEENQSDIAIESLTAYDDASILKLIQANFSTQIRGTLAKGDKNYLQLNGGGMMQEGDSFPVKVPQIKDKSFTVIVQDITTRGYKLKMNDTIQEVTFEKTSGIIKDSNN